MPAITHGTLAALFLFHAVAGAQTLGEFFDNRDLHEIHLDVNANDWQTLRDRYLEDTFYRAEFRWKELQSEAGIRSRGSGSRSPHKPNLLVRFDRYDSSNRFLGIRRVVLKAGNQDASMLSETMSLWLTHLMGLPASRAAHTRLFVNGEYFGLYTIIEDITDDFLANSFDDRGGFLYEYDRTAGFRFEYRGDDPSQYAFFEPKTHENQPELNVLAEMVKRVNLSSPAQFTAEVSPYLDLERFVRLIAIQNFVSDNDGILSDVFGMNNFYLYRPSLGGPVQFIPWDMDLTFSWPYRPLLQGIDGNVLARRALEVPELKRLYLQTLIEAAEISGGEGGAMQQEIARQYALIAEAARSDPHKQCMKTGVPAPCTEEDFEEGANVVAATPPIRTPFVLDEALRLLALENPPMLVSAVVNAATHQPELAPGALATIYGEGLATTVAHADSFPLPAQIDGVAVTVNGVPAPLLYISPVQVNFQMPWSLDSGAITVTISRAGGTQASYDAEVAAAAPGIFAAVHAADFSPVTTTHPAEAGGAITVFATGLGRTTPPAAEGEPPTEGAHSIVESAVEVTIGDVTADVLFAGLAPGLVGVYQVNAIVPEGTPAGDATPLVIRVNGQASPPSALPTR